MGPSVLSSGQTVNEESIYSPMLKLSRRMQLIYDQLLPGEPVWDFCCDHGYMGLNAYESGVFPQVYFVDQVPEIIERLRTRFTQEYFKKDFSSEAHFLSIPGEHVNTPLTGTVVLAGVGAHTIQKILVSAQEKGLLQARRFILCPQNHEHKISSFFLEKHAESYRLCNEHYETMEKGRIRKLLIFDKI